jgi:hypothetical protein
MSAERQAAAGSCKRVADAGRQRQGVLPSGVFCLACIVWSHITRFALHHEREWARPDWRTVKYWTARRIHGTTLLLCSHRGLGTSR